jgi:hypothetical protein
MITLLRGSTLRPMPPRARPWQAMRLPSRPARRIHAVAEYASCWSLIRSSRARLWLHGAGLLRRCRATGRHVPPVERPEMHVIAEPLADKAQPGNSCYPARLAERVSDCPRRHKNEFEINFEINIAIRHVPVALRSIRRGTDATAVAGCPSAQRSARCDSAR